MEKSNASKLSVVELTLSGMMLALTAILWYTRLGRIETPLVTLTIAHVPAIIAAIILGPRIGLIVSLGFGLMSLTTALNAPATILDPLFVNPLVSLLPRGLMPLTAYYTYKGLYKMFQKTKLKKNLSLAISMGSGVVIGSLTNTFGCYSMLYIVYAKEILEKSGQPASNLIIGAFGIGTLLETGIILLVSIPILIVLYLANKQLAKK